MKASSVGTDRSGIPATSSGPAYAERLPSTRTWSASIGPSLGHKRAIAEAARECIEQVIDQFTPFTEMQAALTERYGREMAVFQEVGGY